MSPLVVLVLANSADPGEMQRNAAFPLGLHCLPKCPFKGSSIQRVNKQQNSSAGPFAHILQILKIRQYYTTR